MPTATAAATRPNTYDAVEELFTEAKVEALNAALRERGIAADRIVAIFTVPAQIVVNPTPPRFHVLYRAA